MNETQKMLLQRRSVRAFLDKPLENAHLEAILEAARSAPSSMNKQARFFAVFRGQKAIDELLDNVRAATRRLPESRYTARLLSESYTLNFGAPVFIMVLANPSETSSPDMDCAAALENMFLSARALEVGSCWINQLCFVHEDPQFYAWMASKGIPEGYACYCSGTFGHPAGEWPSAPKQRENTVVIID